MQYHKPNDLLDPRRTHKHNFIAPIPANRMQPGVVTMAQRWPRGYTPPDHNLPLESEACGSRYATPRNIST